MTDEIPKDGITSDNQKLYELQNEGNERRGLPSLEKAQGLGPCSVEIRGFKSLPPHFLWVLLGIRGRILLFLQALSVHQRKQGLHLYALSTRAYKTKQGDRNMISALDDILEDFLMYLRVERSISGGVARCYCWSVGRFLRWTDTLNPDRRDAVKYLDRLWKEEKKESTIRNILFGLKHYYSLLAKNWI